MISLARIVGTLIVAAFAVAAAQAQMLTSNLQKKHCLFLENGKPVRYLMRGDGTIDRSDGPTADSVIASLAQDPRRKRIVIHFHGGLVAPRSALNTAGVLYRDAYGQKAYPIFFVWNSGVDRTVQDTYPKLAKNPLFQAALKTATHYFQAKPRTGSGQDRSEIFVRKPTDDPSTPGGELVDPNRVSVQEMEALAERFAADVAQSEAAQAESLEVGAYLQTAPEITDGMGAFSTKSSPDPDRDLYSPRLLDETKSTAKSSARDEIAEAFRREVRNQSKTIFWNIVNRVRTGRYRTVGAMTREEILRAFFVGDVGRNLWSTMKAYTHRSFEAGGGGHAFQIALDRYLRKIPAAQRPEITLVGHSAGAIYVSEFLEAIHRTRLAPGTKFNVILMAPAVDFDQFQRAVRTQRIAKFRMFALSDDLERREELVPSQPGLYTGSLLYFVSNVLESEPDRPLLGMQRFFQNNDLYARMPAVATARNFVAQHTAGTVWSVGNAGAGRATSATIHSAFDDANQSTIKSLAYLITAPRW